MVLLILDNFGWVWGRIKIYIPLWFYLYEIPRRLSGSGRNLIYIPLWFYLYWIRKKKLPAIKIFTFHYGSTYTGKNWNTSTALPYLHSTMVLLIPSAVGPATVADTYLHSTMVLLIRSISNKQTWQLCGIYIPLWFYLYHFSTFFYCSVFKFTFHYGSTYTGQGRTRKPQGSRFTFHYGSTYTAKMMKVMLTENHLHSTMVLLIQGNKTVYQGVF